MCSPGRSVPRYARVGKEGINWESGTDLYTLLYLKQITSKDLLYSTGNTAQYSVIT